MNQILFTRTNCSRLVWTFTTAGLFSMLLVTWTSGETTAQAAEESVNFARDIQPILEDHCLRCHSPGIRKGELSLATSTDLIENAYLVPGDPDASHLVELLTADKGKKAQMPKEGVPLSAEQVGIIRSWISAGAVWPKDVTLREQSKADETWWSLQALFSATPPISDKILSDWKENPIDRFIYEKLAAAGLSPNPRADRRTLIRRATYDLTGLPPTPKEVSTFLADTNPSAYEQLIDRLLASPHYGERWGRHWLDVVRFGESNGYERNVIINDLWPFRDYVIRSFNEDKPFNQFIREHLAGDVIGENQPDKIIGSAFLVAGPYDDVNNQDAAQAAQIRANTIDEMIRATCEAFLGLTVGCARCHDHKFDPILQRDYYALYATFAGIRHGSQPLATKEEIAAQQAKTQALQKRSNTAKKQQDVLRQAILERAEKHASEYEQRWTREAIHRAKTEDHFKAVEANWIRLITEGLDTDFRNKSKFGIDEFEVWSAGSVPTNVALAANGGRAFGKARENKDFPGSYGPQLAIDGKTGARFLAQGGSLTIQFSKPTQVNRVLFSSARNEVMPENPKFAFVAEYRLEISQDGQNWVQIANSHDRKPVNAAHRKKRLLDLETTDTEKLELAQLQAEIRNANAEISKIPPLPTVWIGKRAPADAKGPFHIFQGGSPQRKGDTVVPSSLAVLKNVVPAYALESNASESDRRSKLADWIVHPNNPLTARVLVNRLWHYHFGTGLVDTPSDFGYMGGKPTHPELLDFLAAQLYQNGWRIKPLHKLLMMSQTYQQASDFRESASNVDSDARLLWRFPPRRLSAEEIRDTILMVADKLVKTSGGPGFRLYNFMQDNVSTYAPLAEHGPETYRRAVYHQNVRASVVDLMTDFDQPDCAFSTPRRAATTSPLQALTMLNHKFSLDMASYFSTRLKREAGADIPSQIQRAYAICYGREPSQEELKSCSELVREHSLTALCRVLLNTSELIYVE